MWLFGLGTGSRQGLKGRYYVCAHVPVLPNQYLLCIIVRTYVRTAVGTWWLPLQSLLYSCVTIYSTYVGEYTPVLYIVQLCYYLEELHQPGGHGWRGDAHLTA